MIITMCKMENLLNGINNTHCRRKYQELEDTAIETTENKTQRVKRIFF